MIPTLYQATKQYGRSEIPVDLIDENNASAVDPQTQEFLQDVVSKYSHLTGIQLSNLTHLPGTPWHQVYEPNVMGKEIPDSLIRSHYVEKLNEYRQLSPAATQ